MFYEIRRKILSYIYNWQFNTVLTSKKYVCASLSLYFIQMTWLTIVKSWLNDYLHSIYLYLYLYLSVSIYRYIYMVFITEGFFRSSYTKLAWVGFEPTTTEFRSDALTDWAIGHEFYIYIHIYDIYIYIHMYIYMYVCMYALYICIYIYMYLYYIYIYREIDR